MNLGDEEARKSQVLDEPERPAWGFACLKEACRNPLICCPPPDRVMLPS